MHPNEIAAERTLPVWNSFKEMQIFLGLVWTPSHTQSVKMMALQCDRIKRL